ncbi:MAG: leucine--tRNA ligase [Parcubacteria group bacterium]|nr:MAG: leucine--tRNA ligase [Parcubacteria group bacterium]
MKYNFKATEKKWQQYWQREQTWLALDNSKKKKFYSLIEFPYPSGDGLHVGHLRPITAMDVISRQRRMAGENVLYPIGMDTFGLPAENYAIKTNTPPKVATKRNIANFNRQLQMLGYSFDWSRFFSTSDEDYYHWTQWIFIQLWKNGLAYKAKENINWCLSCQIGLANEEVVGGVCERCGGAIVKKEKEQWLLRISKYADRLIDGLKRIDFLEPIKKQQTDWIGRSEGVEVDFAITNSDQKLKVFTTRPDTLFGVTFMVLAPEHPIIHRLEGQIKNLSAIKKYISAARGKSDIDRGKEKSGLKLEGVSAINPVNKKEIPIFVADYVMMSYGTGAIMAVPAHDQRDWEFAKKYKLNIVPVISGGDIKKEAYTDTESGQMINSDKYNGFSVKKFQKEITGWLSKNKIGKKTVNYKLHDWIFSRQRYWGEPIPMVYCEKDNWQAVPEKDLPVVLPDIKDFKPTADGQSPLAKLDKWINTKCPVCGGPARRETDVMPNWGGSNWYFIRYTDPRNKKQLVDPKKAKYWLPVDWYNGGMEHTNLHLLYSRFIYKFLFDIGVIPKECGDEPYAKRTAHGLILAEGGVKMSKSKGNVINPDDIVAKYGADALRVYEMFMGPFDQTIAWDDQGVTGVFRFLNRIWALADKIGAVKTSKESERLLHQSIKKVSTDIEQMHFNTAVSQLMILLNHLEKQEKINKDLWADFIKLLSPLAPHLSAELWQKLGHKNNLAYESWPKYDVRLAQEEKIILGIQVNGKLRDTIELDYDTAPSKELEKEILSQEKIQRCLQGLKIRKFIHVKNKIISIVAN